MHRVNFRLGTAILFGLASILNIFIFVESKKILNLIAAICFLIASICLFYSIYQDKEK